MPTFSAGKVLILDECLISRLMNRFVVITCREKLSSLTIGTGIAFGFGRGVGEIPYRIKIRTPFSLTSFFNS